MSSKKVTTRSAPSASSLQKARAKAIAVRKPRGCSKCRERAQRLAEARAKAAKAASASKK